MTVEFLVALIKDWGALGVTMIIIGAGFLRIWMFTWVHDLIVREKDKRIEDLEKRLEEIIEDRDRWLDAAIHGKEIARIAVEHIPSPGGD